ncbi:hypothetical protein BX600DRAFT_474720 [Xylariales sp. PMI_506]|nr:hypothetical protein BX600DRAFT_474720 [Xylariales sp. PMI_506]
MISSPFLTRSTCAMLWPIGPFLFVNTRAKTMTPSHYMWSHFRLNTVILQKKSSARGTLFFRTPSNTCQSSYPPAVSFSHTPSKAARTRYTGPSAAADVCASGSRHSSGGFVAEHPDGAPPAEREQRAESVETVLCGARSNTHCGILCLLDILGGCQNGCDGLGIDLNLLKQFRCLEERPKCVCNALVAGSFAARSARPIEP